MRRVELSFMKKNVTLMLGIVTLMVACCGSTNGQACFPESPMVEFRTSYFRPSSSEIRDLFHDGRVNYQLTGTCPIYGGPMLLARGINLWGAVDYLSVNGRSLGLAEKTTLRMVPLTLGIKYFSPSIGAQCPIHFYAAGGMKYYFVHSHNSSDAVQRSVNRHGMGGVLEAGLMTTLLQHYLFDLFMAYSFKSFRAPSTSNPAVEGRGLNVSGLNVGAGIGYKF